MAIVEMKKVTAISNTCDHERIMKLLVDFGVAEITPLNEFDGTSLTERQDEKDVLTSRMALLSFALEFVEKQIKEAKRLAGKGVFNYEAPKKSLFAPSKISVPKDDFEKILERESEILELVAEIEKCSKTRIELDSKIAKDEIYIESLKTYRDIDASFDMFTDSKLTKKVLGSVSKEKIEFVDNAIRDFPNACIVYSCVPEGEKDVPIVFIALKTDYENLLSALQDADFVKCDNDSEFTADQIIASLNKDIELRKQAILDNIMDAVSYKQYEDLFKTLYDYYKMQYALQEATETFRFTKSTFTFCFWTPAKEVQNIRELLDKNEISCFMIDEDPSPDDLVPTYTENNPIVSPYESITNMYSVPNYREKDPNTIMSIFYFVLFGIMLGDAAYGLLLALIGFGAYLLKKPRKGEGKLLLVIAMGGISTAIWGFLFGSWFGITPDKSKLWYWFNPLEDPLKMLILSLGIGFLQIIVGMFLQSINLFRERKPLDAIFNIYGWYVAFIGIGLYALNVFILHNEALNLAGLIVAVVGVVMLFAGGLLGKNKKFFSRILGGFKNIYGVTNILSDVLSYARLFGLGLATGVVAMVVNQICSVIRDLLSFNIVGIIIGWLVSIVIYAVGHVFNLAINTLGTYVHNCRLQYVEFYGRFYTGGGRVFKPLGKDKKYIYVD